MNMILVCGSGSSVDEMCNFLCETGKFGVQLFSHGLDMASGVISAMRPELLIIHIPDMMDSSYLTLVRIQNEEPMLKMMAMGSAADYSTFTTKFMGTPIEQLASPFQKKEGLAAICRAVGISFSEVKDAIPPDAMSMPGLPGMPGMPGAGSQYNSAKRTIMVIDDNAMTLRSMKGLLEDEFNVMIANSGPKAFKMMERQVPSLILLDYEMPEMDGRAVMQKLRMDESLFLVPVIFLTGVNDRDHISAALALRPAGYLLKPVAKARLLSTIDSTLEATANLGAGGADLFSDEAIPFI
ncbi:MAG: response regulator [Lachnospiraceae bacterium]|nr:response regulator [Lachnospiraceae bacterium]